MGDRVYVKVTLPTGRHIVCHMTSGKAHSLDQCEVCGFLTETGLSLLCEHSLCEECYAMCNEYTCKQDNMLTRKEQARRKTRLYDTSLQKAILECPICGSLKNYTKIARHIREKHPEPSKENSGRSAEGRKRKDQNVYQMPLEWTLCPALRSNEEEKHLQVRKEACSLVNVQRGANQMSSSMPSAVHAPNDHNGCTKVLLFDFAGKNYTCSDHPCSPVSTNPTVIVSCAHDTTELIRPPTGHFGWGVTSSSTAGIKEDPLRFDFSGHGGPHGKLALSMPSILLIQEPECSSGDRHSCEGGFAGGMQSDSHITRATAVQESRIRCHTERRVRRIEEVSPVRLATSETAKTSEFRVGTEGNDCDWSKTTRAALPKLQESAKKLEEQLYLTEKLLDIIIQRLSLGA